MKSRGEALRDYVVRRLLLMIPTFIGITFVTFLLTQFVPGGVLVNIFAVRYRIFPLEGFSSPNIASMTFPGQVGDVIWHSVLPLIAYLASAFAIETMLMKNSLMENMSADYVRTALAKGLTWRRAVFVHALRNSLIPMATSIGGLLGIFLTGSVLIERVFNIQGMGLLGFEAIQSRDFPVVMGFLVISSLILMLGNLVSDLAVAAVDPRVRFE